MRTHGTLIKWNDERGFGFISSAHGGTELFVHVSAFQHGTERPRIGELVSYESEVGPNGKLRAVRAMRAGETRAVRPRTVRLPARRQSLASTVIALMLMAAVVAFGYSRVTASNRAKSSVPSPVERVTAPTQPAAIFTCDRRTMCSQMTSCKEATEFIEHCADTQMDGDKDGVPCESQWCN